MARVGARERRRLRVEGVFLNPAHAGVRTWLAQVAREIVTRYDVDGIHLDYIREPGVSLGSDPESRVGFALEHGVDPERLGALSPGRRAVVDSLWLAWQAGQVTAVVREVRDSLERVRPGLQLSAAVLADPEAAERHHAQPWAAWIRSGLLDRAFVMCYAPGVQTVLEQMLAVAAGWCRGSRCSTPPRRMPPPSSAARLSSAFAPSPSIRTTRCSSSRATGRGCAHLSGFRRSPDREDDGTDAFDPARGLRSRAARRPA